MATVETALGPVSTTELGPTLMHEHVVTRSPGVQENWPHLWDRDAILALAEQKMADLYRRGIRALVDLTTVGPRARHRPHRRRGAALARPRDRGHRRLVDAPALLQRPRRRR